MSNYQLLRASDRIAQPWKNGGGTMWDVAIFPERATTETFAWRLSIAEINSSRPFSAFPGVTRHFAVLAGDGVTLAITGRPPVRITPASCAIEFSGDDETAANLHGGPVFALNLMVREGFRGSLRPLHPDGIQAKKALGCDIAILVAAAHGLTFSSGETDFQLSGQDAMKITASHFPSLNQLEPGHWLATITQRLPKPVEAQIVQQAAAASPDTIAEPK